jgi:hypothetical protein
LAASRYSGRLLLSISDGFVVFVGHNINSRTPFCHRDSPKKPKKVSRDGDKNTEKQQKDSKRQRHATPFSLSPNVAQPKYQEKFPTKERRRKIRFGDSQRRKDDHKSQLEFQFGFCCGTESIAKASSASVSFREVFSKFSLLRFSPNAAAELSLLSIEEFTRSKADEKTKPQEIKSAVW